MGYSGDINNKPSCRVSPLPTIFLAKKLSKFRLKPPKCRVRGIPEKPEKTKKQILPRETTNFYVQEYGDINLNAKLEKSRI